MAFADIVYNLFSVAVGAASGHLFTRRKTLAEARKSELDSIQVATNIWKELAEGLREEVQQLIKKCEQLDSELQAMRKENRSLKGEIQSLRKSINETNKNHE